MQPLAEPFHGLMNHAYAARASMLNANRRSTKSAMTLDTKTTAALTPTVAQSHSSQPSGWPPAEDLFANQASDHAARGEQCGPPSPHVGDLALLFCKSILGEFEHRFCDRRHC